MELLIRNPHVTCRSLLNARPTDGCVLAPGVRYCICHGDEARDPIAELSVRDGQLYWCVGARIGATYVALLARGDGFEAVELSGPVEFRVEQTLVALVVVDV